MLNGRRALHVAPTCCFYKEIGRFSVFHRLVAVRCGLFHRLGMPLLQDVQTAHWAGIALSDYSMKVDKLRFCLTLLILVQRWSLSQSGPRNVVHSLGIHLQIKAT